METFASLVYLLCLATSIVCAVLLVRAYRHHRTGLLLWSAVCFALLALNNLVMVLDILVFTQVDLSIARNLCNLAATGTLLYGFIWESDR